MITNHLAPLIAHTLSLFPYLRSSLPSTLPSTPLQPKSLILLLFLPHLTLSLSGHGKLFSGDRGYYEGHFVHGEIQGHGYKVFGISGTIYTGQFHRGEMEGQGLMRKLNGEQYEGSWFQNKMQGNTKSWQYMDIVQLATL